VTSWLKLFYILTLNYIRLSQYRRFKKNLNRVSMWSLRTTIATKTLNL